MSQKEPPDLPGYYFDKKKNRYFKLIPGQEHKNPLTGQSLTKNLSTSKISISSVGELSLPKNANHQPNNVASIPKLLVQRNILSHLKPFKSMQSFRNSIIKDIFLRKQFEKVIYGCVDFHVHRILPSSKDEKVLLQAEMLTLMQAECFDAKLGALKFSYFYEFPAESGSTITDVSFASITSFESGILASIVPPWGGSSCLYLGPEANNYMFRKFREDYISACKWHESYLLYSLNGNIVIVYNWERHFATASVLNESADLIKPHFSNQSQVTALDCTESVAYAGFLNNRIVGYDKRALRRKSLCINTGETGRNVCCLKVLKNDFYILSRHGNTKDIMYLWDLRNTKQSVLQYGLYDNKQNIGFRGMHKSFLVDSAEQVLSCYNIDNMFRLYDLKSGSVLAQTTELNGGIYSENFSFMKNKPGILGLKNNNVVWLSL